MRAAPLHDMGRSGQRRAEGVVVVERHQTFPWNSGRSLSLPRLGFRQSGHSPALVPAGIGKGGGRLVALPAMSLSTIWNGLKSGGMADALLANTTQQGLKWLTP